MSKLIFIFVLALSIMSSCSQPKTNSNQAPAQQEVKKKVEKKDLPKESSKMAEGFIQRLSESVTLTEDQKSSILKKAEQFNFGTENDEMNIKSFRSFREDVRINILTDEQRSLIKKGRKN